MILFNNILKILHMHIVGVFFAKILFSLPELEKLFNTIGIVENGDSKTKIDAKRATKTVRKIPFTYPVRVRLSKALK